jgi:hypothetical protein
VDVFPVDVFGGGGQQKNSANKTDVFQERQVYIGLQEIKDGRNQNTEQDRIVENKDDFFGEFVRPSFRIKLCVDACKIPGAGTDGHKNNLEKQGSIAYMIEVLYDDKSHSNGNRIKCIPQYIVKALVLFHLSHCKIQKKGMDARAPVIVGWLAFEIMCHKGFAENQQLFFPYFALREKPGHFSTAEQLDFLHLLPGGGPGSGTFEVPQVKIAG